MKRAKLTIVGAGNVGASCAVWAVQKELGDVVLLDIPDFADKTKEIVLQRGRRRLERSRTNLDIRSKTFLFLQNHSLPLEHKELQFKLEQASLLLAKTQRDAKAGELDKQIAILTAEAGVAKLEFELQVLDEEDDEEDDNEEDKE